VNSFDGERTVKTWYVFGDTELAFFTTVYVGIPAVGSGELDAFTDLVVGVRSACLISLLGLCELGGKKVVLSVLEIGFKALYDVRSKDICRNL
jgi:hypothetical protein